MQIYDIGYILDYIQIKYTDLKYRLFELNSMSYYSHLVILTQYDMIVL